MGTIRGLASAMRALDLPTASERIITETSDEIIALNQQQLYNKSLNSLSVALKEYKTLGYSLRKYEQNPGPGLRKPDLNLTGSFYRGFYVTPQRYGFTVNSYDLKTNRLTTLYGKTIFGLNRQSKTKYVQTIYRPKFNAYITQTTGLRFN